MMPWPTDSNRYTDISKVVSSFAYLFYLVTLLARMFTAFLWPAPRYKLYNFFGHYIFCCSHWTMNIYPFFSYFSFLNRVYRMCTLFFSFEMLAGVRACIITSQSKSDFMHGMEYESEKKTNRQKLIQYCCVCFLCSSKNIFIVLFRRFVACFFCIQWTQIREYICLFKRFHLIQISTKMKQRKEKIASYHIHPNWDSNQAKETTIVSTHRANIVEFRFRRIQFLFFLLDSLFSAKFVSSRRPFRYYE